jgi:hypothetical protein
VQRIICELASGALWLASSPHGPDIAPMDGRTFLEWHFIIDCHPACHPTPHCARSKYDEHMEATVHFNDTQFLCMNGQWLGFCSILEWDAEECPVQCEFTYNSEVYRPVICGRDILPGECEWLPGSIGYLCLDKDGAFAGKCISGLHGWWKPEQCHVQCLHIPAVVGPQPQHKTEM